MRLLHRVLPALLVSSLAAAGSPGAPGTGADDRFVPAAQEQPAAAPMRAPSPLAVTSWGVGRVDVFHRSDRSTLEQTTYAAGLGWTPAPSLGGSMASGPTAAATEPGRMHVALRGADGAVWIKRYESPRWSGWSSLGGRVVGEPALVASGPGRLDLFARLDDDTLGHRALRDGRWNDWVSLGGTLTSSPAAAVPGQGRLVVFARSSEQAIWEKSYDGRNWQPWTRVGGAATSSPAAAGQSDGTVDLYVRGTDDALYHRSVRDGRWSGWTPLGGALASGPAATSWTVGHRLVLVLGTNGKVYQRSFSAGRWSGYAAPPVTGVTRSFEEQLARGVEFRSVIDPAGPVAMQIVSVDLAAPSTLDTALGTTELAGLERTSSIAARHDALVAVNGDFALSNGRPVHLFAEDGRLLQNDQATGRNFAVRADETAGWIDFPKPDISVARADGSRQAVGKVNSGGPGVDEVIGFTAEGGSLKRPSGNGCSARLRSASRPRLDGTGAVEQTQLVDLVKCDGEPLPADGSTGDILSAAIGGSKEGYITSLSPGELLAYRWRLTGWPGVFDSIGGNPTLVENGRIAPSVDGSGSFFGRNPRTAVGLAPGKVFLVVVDGRQPAHSVGMTLRELAGVFVGLGATHALNLDGGGSSTMVVNGRITNRPSDGAERGVANALLLLPGTDPGEALQPAAVGGAPRQAVEDGRRFADPGSTGGYADALRRQRAPVGAALRSAADRFAESTEISEPEG